MRIAIFALCTFTAFAQRVPSQEAVVVPGQCSDGRRASKQMTTVVKGTADIPNLSFDEAHSSFALKSPANQLGLAEWLLRAMDKPAGWKPSAEEAENLSTRQYRLQPGSMIDWKTEWPITRIHYLHTSNNLDVRTGDSDGVAGGGGDPKNLSIRSGRHGRVPGNRSTRRSGGLVDRQVGTSRRMARRSPNNRAIRQAEIFTIANGNGGSADDLVRVFYLDSALKPADIQARTKNIRETTKTLRVFQKTSPPTIVVRGSSALLAQAQQIIEVH